MESTHLRPLSLLLFLSLITATSAVPRASVLRAAKTLSKTGFMSMALTLAFGNTTLLPLNTRTIFAPPDTAFFKLGRRPPVSLLHYHFSPLPISVKTLTLASNIPSFLPNHSLTVTSLPQNGRFTLNHVNVSASALFRDAFLTVFGTQGFFDPNFVNGSSKDSGFTCGGGRKQNHTVGDASGVLKIAGFSIMAAFLDLQVGEFSNNTPMTVFAPPDVALKGSVGNFTRFRSVFLRHLVPCRISGSDLESIGDGEMVFPTFLEGFSLEFKNSGSEMRIGGVNITDVDMFSNEWMVVHGIQKSILVEEEPARNPRDFARSSSDRLNMVTLLLYATMVFAFAFLLYSQLITFFSLAVTVLWHLLMFLLMLLW